MDYGQYGSAWRMKLIIFSDIHGNFLAFQAFLDKIKSISYDYLVFCGDIFGYYYAQNEIIRGLACMEKLIWLKGNHDDYALNIYRGKAREDYFIEHYGHSYENIKARFQKEEIKLLASHDSKYVLYTKACKIGMFHGTPENSLEGRLYPDKPVLGIENYTCYDYVILGHTHCRMERYVEDTLVINSGSLGQPRDGWGYGFAVLDTDLKKVEFQTVKIEPSLLYHQIDKYDPGLKKLKEVLERVPK